MLEQAKSEGAVGVRVPTSANGHRLDEPQYEPFWAKSAEFNLPIFLHPAYERDLPEFADFRLGAVVGLNVEVTVTLERMIYKGVFDRHPKLTVVGALGGGFFPYNAGRLRHYAMIDPSFEGLTKRDPWSYVGQIKFDCFLHDVGQIRFLIQQAGAENVLIGTDASFASLMPDPVGMVRQAVDGDEKLVKLIGDTNARALFGDEGCHAKFQTGSFPPERDDGRCCRHCGGRRRPLERSVGVSFAPHYGGVALRARWAERHLLARGGEGPAGSSVSTPSLKIVPAATR